MPREIQSRNPGFCGASSSSLSMSVSVHRGIANGEGKYSINSASFWCDGKAHSANEVITNSPYSTSTTLNFGTSASLHDSIFEASPTLSRLWLMFSGNASTPQVCNSVVKIGDGLDQSGRGRSTYHANPTVLTRDTTGQIAMVDEHDLGLKTMRMSTTVRSFLSLANTS